MSAKLIRNPHEHLPPPPTLDRPTKSEAGNNDGDAPSEYETVFVSGNYEYHHYLEDGFDDRGWGCAYRTAQTLSSWLPGDRVPSLPEMQRVLDERCPHLARAREAILRARNSSSAAAQRDSAFTFAGSREWIGTVEAAAVLAEWHGENAKLVTRHVRDGGAERAACAEWLSVHFKGGGGPVLVGGDGGGAIAVLGVARGRPAPDAKIFFAVLDPHLPRKTLCGDEGSAIGGDSPAEIVRAGWCRWDSGSGFLAPGQWYNMLLPSVPGSSAGAELRTGVHDTAAGADAGAESGGSPCGLGGAPAGPLGARGWRAGAFPEGLAAAASGAAALLDTEWPRSGTASDARRAGIGSTPNCVDVVVAIPSEGEAPTRWDVVGYARIVEARKTSGPDTADAVAPSKVSCALSVVVRGDLRGRGVGRFVMQCAEAAAREDLAVSSMYLSAAPEARRFYEALGYVSGASAVTCLHTAAAGALQRGALDGLANLFARRQREMSGGDASPHNDDTAASPSPGETWMSKAIGWETLFEVVA